MENQDRDTQRIDPAGELSGASEEKYKTVFDIVPISIILTDAKGIIVDINPFHITSIGKGKTTKADYVGKNLITHPAIVNAGLSDTYRKLHEKGEPFDIKEVYFPYTTGGVPCYFNVRGVPIYKDGKIIGAISIHEDITERIKIQEEIEKHYKVQEIVNSLLRISLENIPFQSQLERALETLITTSFIPFLSMGAIFLVEEEPQVLVLKAGRNLPDSLKAACQRVDFDECLCGQAAQTGKTVFAETAATHKHCKRHKDDTPHGHYILPILSGDKTLGVLMLYVQEGHKPNREEEDFLQAVVSTLAIIIERNRAQEAYWKAHERFAGIYNASKDAIGYANVDGVLLDVNEAFAKLTGYSREELLSGKRYQELTPPEYHETEAKKIAEILRTGEPQEYEKEYVRKDGSRVPILLTVFEIMGLDSRPMGVAAIVKDITEQKRVQAALEAEREQLKLLYEYSPEGIVIMDKDYRITYANPKAEEISGVPFSRLKGRRCFEVIMNHDSPCEGCGVEEVARTGKPLTRVKYEITSAGRENWVQQLWYPILDSAGGVGSVVEIIKDISAEKAAELSLKMQKQEQEAILDSVPAMIFYKDTQNGMVRVNRAFVEAMGIPRGKIEGKSCFELWPQEAEHYWRDDKEVIQSGRPKTNIIEPLVTAKGTRWVQTDKIPFRDEKGNIIGIIGFAIDVTERKKAEDELRRSEEKYRGLYDSLIDGFVMTDMQGRILECNQGYLDMLGYTKQEIRKLKYQDLTPAKWHRMEEQVVSGLIMRRGYSDEYEKEYVRKSGEVFPVAIRVWLVREDEQGNPASMWGIVRDITQHKLVEQKGRELAAAKAKIEAEIAKADELKKAYDNLKEMQESLIRAEKLAALGKLAAMVGHELRNTLGVIKNSVYFLRLRLKAAAEDEKIKRHLQMLDDEVDSSDKIITDILTFTRIQEPKLSAVKVNDVIRKSFRKVRIPRAVKAVTRLGRSLPEIQADAAQLEQVFHNIILNAVEAMPDGGRLTVTSSKKNGLIEVEISDTGKGVPEENLKKIFEPLFTTKAHGIGLGLSLCQDVIRGHKGVIEVKSAAGKGTIFIVKLPFSETKEPAIKATG